MTFPIKTIKKKTTTKKKNTLFLLLGERDDFLLQIQLLSPSLPLYNLIIENVFQGGCIGGGGYKS